MAGEIVDTVGGARRWLKPAVLDRLEQAAIVILWLLLAQRVWSSGNPFAPLLLISETSVMIFVLIRRPTEAISVRLGDWLLAITATAAPLLILPVPDAWPALAPLGLALVLLGNCFQIWAKLFLRRSFGIAPANRGIKRTGPYRYVRHPMYAGYMLSHIGIFMLMPSLLNLTIYVIGWSAQILRLNAEENLLGLDSDYRAFMGKVKYRLIPGIY